MSKFVLRSVPFLFVLTLASAAAARRPPALVEAQERTDRVYATCTDGVNGAGYREMFSRVGTPQTTAHYLAVSSPPPRKMGDHLVLVCKGGAVHLGSGYRGFPARLLRDEAPEVQVASASTLGGKP
jgi:hypothetical protein